MTPELKTKWAAALESGEYEQARTQLRSGPRYMCCLGVLCDLYDPRKWRMSSVGWVFINEEGMPPQEVLDDIGLSYREADQLAGFNDAGESFAQIAQRVRDLPEGELT